MKANELRIGNWVNYPMYDKTGEISEWIDGYQIDAEDIIFIERNLINTYEPIPLTEEWLLKFGFENNPYEEVKGSDVWFPWYTKKGEYNFDLDASFDYSRTDGSYVKIKYVHQLQNLYFALTGEELTIKDL